MNKLRYMLRNAACAAAVAMPVFAQATPITYEFYVVTNGSLGGWSFDNAMVHFRHTPLSLAPPMTIRAAKPCASPP